MRRVALVAAVVPLFFLAPTPARAQQTAPVDVQAVGWWSSRPTAVAQPEQGFEVAAGPQGDAQSVAAIRLSIAASQVDTLEVQLIEGAGGSIGAEFGSLKVCTTTDAWSPANPGPSDAAPTPDCSVSALLTRTTEGSWLGDLSALVPGGGQVSLVIVPQYQPPAPVGPGLLVTIASGEFAATGSTPETTTTDDTSSSGGDSGPSDTTADFYGSFGGGTFDSGSYSDGTIVVPPADSGNDIGSTTTSIPAASDASGSGDDFALAPVAVDGGSAPPWIRLIILIPLCTGFGVGVVRLRRVLTVRGLLPAA
jgi:hypothetical protein